MPKFIIRHNAGYGNSYSVVEAETMSEAEELAYEAWREEAESNADYDAMEYTEENCNDYDLEWEE